MHRPVLNHCKLDVHSYCWQRAQYLQVWEAYTVQFVMQKCSNTTLLCTDVMHGMSTPEGVSAELHKDLGPVRG
jgi:hypothetical protein